LPTRASAKLEPSPIALETGSSPLLGGRAVPRCAADLHQGHFSWPFAGCDGAHLAHLAHLLPASGAKPGGLSTSSATQLRACSEQPRSSIRGKVSPQLTVALQARRGSTSKHRGPRQEGICWSIFSMVKLRDAQKPPHGISEISLLFAWCLPALHPSC